MNEMVSKIVAGVITGLIMYYLTQNFLPNHSAVDVSQSRQAEAATAVTPAQSPGPVQPVQERTVVSREEAEPGAAIAGETAVPVQSPVAAAPARGAKAAVKEPTRIEVEGQLHGLGRESRGKLDSISGERGGQPQHSAVRSKADAAITELDEQTK